MRQARMPRFRLASVALVAMFAFRYCSGEHAAISPAYAASAPLWPTGAVLQLNGSTPTTLNLSWPVPSADPGTSEFVKKSFSVYVTELDG